MRNGSLSSRQEGAPDLEAAALEPARAPLDTYMFAGNSLPRAIGMTIAGMMLSCLLFGYFSPYWMRAASDVVAGYEGLLYNQGVPQEFLAYPAALSGRLLGLWYRVMHAVGLQSVDRIGDLPGAPTQAQSDRIWTELIRSARVYSLVLGALYVAVFTLLVHRLTRSIATARRQTSAPLWPIAALACAALAFSSGIALEYRIIRSELPSSALIIVALLAMLQAPFEAGTWARLGWLGLAGLCVALGIVEKVQALLVAVALPVIALAFPPIASPSDGARVQSASSSGRFTTDDGRKWPVAGALAVAAVVCLVPVVRLLAWGIQAMPTTSYIPYVTLGGHLAGVYQWMFPLYVAAAIAAYGRLWKVPPAATLAALSAVTLGLTLGFAVLFLRYDPHVVVAVANPLEHMQSHAGGEGSGVDASSVGGLIGRLVGCVGSALAVHTFVLAPSHRPTLLIEWLAIAAIVVAWRRAAGALTTTADRAAADRAAADRMLCMQAGVLLAAAFALDALFTLRQLKVFYLPFTDPLIIIAGAIAAVPFMPLLLRRNSQRIAMVTLAAYVAWGHAPSVLVALKRADKSADKICVVVAQFTKRITWPDCKPR